MTEEEKRLYGRAMNGRELRWQLRLRFGAIYSCRKKKGGWDILTGDIAPEVARRIEEDAQRLTGLPAVVKSVSFGEYRITND